MISYQIIMIIRVHRLGISSIPAEVREGILLVWIILFGFEVLLVACLHHVDVEVVANNEIASRIIASFD